MNTPPLHLQFVQWFGQPPRVLASAPGRLEVLGNHTDYNAGLTLSCAVAFRCTAALAPIDTNQLRLASTAFDAPPQAFDLDDPIAYAPPGHWANYILGLVAALRERGHAVPGFALGIDSAVPRSAGLSSSAALEMAVLTALTAWLGLDLSPIELARVGQWAESHAVGTQTGLLDQLTSLCGRRDHLLSIDFHSLDYQTLPLPPGWVFVAVDSGVKHDLTQDYNDRRASCEAAAKAMAIATLRDASADLLTQHRGSMADDAYRCATHVVTENQRVRDAHGAIEAGDMQQLGKLMSASHDSSRDHLRNSCPQLDRLVEFARNDLRCPGGRLSGGGFGGITIHLVRDQDAQAYRQDILRHVSKPQSPPAWSAICQIDHGAATLR